jgi:hypothetical protein
MLDALPITTTVHNTRSLFVETGILPARVEHLPLLIFALERCGGGNGRRHDFEVVGEVRAPVPTVRGSADGRAYRLRRKTRCDSGIGVRLRTGRRYRSG